MEVDTKGTPLFVVLTKTSEPLPVLILDIYDLTRPLSDDTDPLYIEELRKRMHATERLVASFVQLGGKQESLLSQTEAHKKCQEAQTEVNERAVCEWSILTVSQCSSLRSEVSLLRNKLRDSEAEKERYHEQLAAAEKRLDRLKSTTAAIMNPDPRQSTTPKTVVKTEEEAITKESPKQEPLPVAPLVRVQLKILALQALSNCTISHLVLIHLSSMGTAQLRKKTQENFPLTPVRPSPVCCRKTPASSKKLRTFICS